VSEALRPASKTALMMAAYRGKNALRPNALCHDPWALLLAGDEGVALAEELDRQLPHRELYVAVRTAYLDAQVSLWTSAPAAIAQVVLLGAGLDTRAQRLKKDGVRFFEVDHPATQADKLQRLAALEGYPIDCATYVPCDFETDDFVDKLREAGFRADRPALILWEGVTYYLTEAAVRATLHRLAAACDPASIVLFDLFRKNLIEGPDRPPRDLASNRFVEALGERFRFGLNDPVPLLYEVGFRHVRTVSFDEACLTLTGTYDRDREFRFQRLVLASVKPTWIP
jgi:methyltransferase (TIGR00027 family)